MIELIIYACIALTTYSCKDGSDQNITMQIRADMDQCDDVTADVARSYTNTHPGYIVTGVTCRDLLYQPERVRQ